MKHLLLICLFLLCTCARAQMVRSVQDGGWYDPATWETGTVPARTDSIWVLHTVDTDSSVHVDSTGYVLVDSVGTLCVGDSFLFECGTFLQHDGYLSVNLIHLHYGLFNGYLGFWRLIVTPCNGYAEVHIHGGASRAWPLCSSQSPPDTTPPPLEAFYPAIAVTLYPNPADDHVWVRITTVQTATGDERYRFILRDMLGKELVTASGLVEGDNWLPLPGNLAVGSYFWHVLPEVRVGTRYRRPGTGVVLVGR